MRWHTYRARVWNKYLSSIWATVCDKPIWTNHYTYICVTKFNHNFLLRIMGGIRSKRGGEDKCSECMRLGYGMLEEMWKWGIFWARLLSRACGALRKPWQCTQMFPSNTPPGTEKAERESEILKETESSLGWTQSHDHGKTPLSRNSQILRGKRKGLIKYNQDK